MASQINLITWTKSNKQVDMLCYGEHMYQFIKPNAPDLHYKCYQASIKCKSSLNLSKDKTYITRTPTAHNHPVPSESIAKVKNNIK